MGNFENRTKEKLWESCIDFLSNVIGEDDIKNWINHIKPIKLEEKVLTVQIPSELFYEHIEENFADYIFNFLEDELGDGADLRYQIPTKDSDKKQQNNRVNKINSNLNENYNFNNYIIGNFNNVAGNIGLKISESPGKTSFNPLVIYGKTGMGKTHLANAIGLRTKKMNQGKKVLYVSSETFIQQYSLSVAQKKRNDFVAFYNDIDVLIVDDIQFLANKTGTQDVFFQIFNHLHQSGKQIVLTSDRLPSEIPDVSDRLISRFKWGLCTELNTPDAEDRAIILKSKLEKDEINISKDVFDFIVSKLNTSIREIEGSVVSLLAHSSLLKTDITLDLAKNILKQYIREIKKDISVEIIKKIVCDYYNVSADKLSSKSRERKIVTARQVAMSLSKKYTDKSLKYIGKSIGDRDYSTVVYACKTLDKLLSTDKILKGDYDFIESKLFS